MPWEYQEHVSARCYPQVVFTLLSVKRLLTKNFQTSKQTFSVKGRVDQDKSAKNCQHPEEGLLFQIVLTTP